MSNLAVETNDLTRKFGSFEALKGVNLRVPRGSIFGLVGPNGAGKTTTFSILCGFLSPTSGTVKVLDADPQDRVALAGRLGALPQDAPLPRMSALDALRYWGELSGMTPAEAIRAATWNAAEALGMERDVGAVAVGRYGDLIAVAADPLADVRALQSVVVVVKGGEVVRNVR